MPWSYKLAGWKFVLSLKDGEKGNVGSLVNWEMFWERWMIYSLERKENKRDEERGSVGSLWN